MDALSPEQLLSYIQIVRELKELAPTPNPWIPLWSVVAGALLGYIPLGVGAILRSRKATKSVQAALLAEVSSLLQIIEARNYLIDFKDTFAELTAANERDMALAQQSGIDFEENTDTTVIAIQDDYNKVFKAYLDKLGLLPPKFATDIVTFYTLIDSIVQDLKPIGVLQTQGYAEQYEEAIILMERALGLAKKLGASKS